MTTADPYVDNRCEEIQELLKDAKAWQAQDAKLGAYLASYVAILILGVVEDSTEHLVRKRVARVKDHEVEQFVNESVGQRFRNPDHGAITGLLNQFSKAYGDAFKTKIPHNSHEADALQSVINIKNATAHSGNYRLSVTISDVETYFKDIILILKELEAVLNT